MPQYEIVMDDDSEGSLTPKRRSSKLGSLKSSARDKRLNSARTALIVAFALLMLEAVVTFLLAQTMMRRMGVPAKSKDSFLMLVYIFCLIHAGIALLYLAFAVLIRRYPLFCTVSGLVIYVTTKLIYLTVILSRLDPEKVVEQSVVPMIINIIVIIFLVRGVSAAVAIRSDELASRDRGDD